MAYPRRDPGQPNQSWILNSREGQDKPWTGMDDSITTALPCVPGEHECSVTHG